jgi:hypothetical protein
MHLRIMFLLLMALIALPATAQTVLFDGETLGRGKAAATLVPAVVTGDDYSLFGRLEFGALDRVDFFGQLGGRFNGGSTGLAGLGWSATLYRQTDQLPVNIGIFNSWIFPLRSEGPDAFATVAPVVSHRFGRRDGTAVTPYLGAGVTFNVGGRGSSTNMLLGLTVNRIALGWDFVAEVQAGQRSQFALGFRHRF